MKDGFSQLDRQKEMQHHLKCATAALGVCMRQILENRDINVKIKADIGSEITIQLYSLVNTQSHSMGDTKEFQRAEKPVTALCEFFSPKWSDLYSKIYFFS